MAGYVPAIDTGWISQIGQTLAGLGQQQAAPGILAGLTGQSAPQSTGFLSNIFGGNQNAAVTSPPGAVGGQGFMPSVLGSQAQQQPMVNPAVAPQVTNAETAHGLTPAQSDAYSVYRAAGLPHSGASALIANLSGEAGPGLNPNATNNTGSDAGGIINPAGAYGLPQLNGPRQEQLQNFAQSQGLDYRDRNTQLQFVAWDLKNNYPDLWSQLNDPNASPQSNLKRLVYEYERPGDKPGAVAQRSQYLGADFPQASPAMMAAAGPVQPGAAQQAPIALASASPAQLADVQRILADPLSTPAMKQYAQVVIAQGQSTAPSQFTNKGRIPNPPQTVQPPAWAGTPVTPPPGTVSGPIPYVPGGAATGAPVDQAIPIPGFKGTWTRAQAAASDPNDTSTPDGEDYDKAMAAIRASQAQTGPAIAPPAAISQAPPGLPAAQQPYPPVQAPPGVVSQAPASQLAQRAPLDMRPAPGQVAPNGVPMVGSSAATPSGQVYQPSLQQIQVALNNPYTKPMGQAFLQQYMQRQQMQQQIQKEQQMALFQHQLQQGRILTPAEVQAAGLPAGVYNLSGNGQITPITGTQADKTRQPNSIQEFEYGQAHPEFARAPKWVPNATTDALGQPVGGWVRPPNPAAPGAQGAGQQGAQEGAGQNTAVIAGKTVDFTQTGDAFLSQLPVTYQQAVKNYVAGETMPTGRGGFVQEIKLLAQKYGNDIGMPADDTTFNARKAMRNSLSVTTPNSLGGQMQFLNTGIGHLETMSENAIALNNSDGWGSTTIAHAVNNLRGLSTDQAAAVAKIQDSAVRYGQELTKFYAGSPGGEQERQAFLANVAAAKSPKELASVIENEAELIPSRGLGLQREIDAGLGPLAKQYQVFQPESKEALEKISKNIGTLRGQNQGVLFPSIAAVPTTRPSLFGPQGGGAGPAAATQPPQGAQRVPIPQGETPATLIMKGRQAIQAGAPAAAVGQRLQGYGIDPSNLVPQQ